MEIDISSALYVQETLAQNEWEQAMERSNPLKEVQEIVQKKYQEVLLAYAAVYRAKSNEIKARLLKPPPLRVPLERAPLIDLDSNEWPKEICFMPVNPDDEKKGDGKSVEVWAHRLVVEAGSPLLKEAAFKQEVIQINKVSDLALKIFVKYLYTNALDEATDSVLEQLYQMGAHFEMEHLMECSKEGHIRKQMELMDPNGFPNPEGFDDILSKCKTLTKLEKKYFTYINIFKQNRETLGKL